MNYGIEMNEAQSREAFEAWIKHRGDCLERFNAPHKASGQYRHLRVQLAWEGWQASAESAERERAESQRLRGLVDTAVGWLYTISSADGSGHRDLAAALRKRLDETP